MSEKKEVFILNHPNCPACGVVLNLVQQPVNELCYAVSCGTCGHVFWERPDPPKPIGFDVEETEEKPDKIDEMLAELEKNGLTQNFLDSLGKEHDRWCAEQKQAAIDRLLQKSTKPETWRDRPALL